MELSEVLNPLNNDVIAESFQGGWPWAPVRFQVTADTTVDRNDPIIWEMFVTNLTHFRLLGIEDFGAERQQRKDNRSLGTQRHTSQLGRVTIDT